MTIILTKELINDQIAVLDLLETHHVDLKALKILLVVARTQGSSMLELADSSGISSSAFSRYVISLSEPKGARKNPFIEVRAHATEYRKKALYLTTYGEKFLHKTLTSCKESF